MTFTLTIADHLLEELHFQSGIYNRSELCSEMVSIYKWLMNEVCAGRIIYAECPGELGRNICDAKTFKNIERRISSFNYGKNRK